MGPPWPAIRDLPSERTYVAPRLSSLRSIVAVAAVIALAAVLLNVAVAHSLLRIGTNAQTMVRGWIRSASSLADVEQGLRDFRQREALYALAEVDSVTRLHRSALDSLYAQIEGSLAQLRRSAPDGALAARVDAVARSWADYAALHRDALSQAHGEGSAAIQAFREREPSFRELTTDVRAAQQSLRQGAGQMAVRNRRTTITSAALLGTSVLLTLAALALAEAVRRSMRARSAAERRWQDVANQSLGIIWEVDARGRISFCSSAGFELLKLSAGQVIGKRALSFIHSDDRRSVLRTARAVVDHGVPLEDLEARIVRADATHRWIAVSGRALQERGERVRTLRGLAVDITRRMQAERALEQRRRLESLGTLAGGVAHDLNNVLTSVGSYATLARDQLPVRHAAVDDVEAIRTAAERGRKLVKHIMQFARQQPIDRGSVDLALVVREVVQLMRPQMPPHAKLEVNLPEAACVVAGNASELHQVVLNVLANALLAVRDGGQKLRVQLRPQGHEAELTIDDDGVGMSDDVKGRALEPFFTTRAVGEGTGMGLAVVHGVVQSMGGRVVIESEVDAGTTVRISLPLFAAHATGAMLTASNAVDVVGMSSHTNGVCAALPEGTRASQRVMLVDDDTMVRNALRRILERAGHRTESFADVASAVDALRADASRADVIVSDLSMPGASGLDFASRLRALAPRVPLVLLSGYLDDASSERAWALGVRLQLHKPVDAVDLLRAVDEAQAAQYA